METDTFTEMLTLGERLTRARRHTEMSREDFARRLDVHPRSIANYESGERAPKFELVCRWAKVTGVPLDYFAAVVTVWQPSPTMPDPRYSIAALADVINMPPRQVNIFPALDAA